MRNLYYKNSYIALVFGNTIQLSQMIAVKV
jgi:hypothetical protein